MADREPRSVEERLLDTLMANTEALANLHASVSNHSREYGEGSKAAREHANSVLAKLDNLDRSIGELKVATEKAESARQAELKHIYDILGEERKDRRAAILEGREGSKEEQEFIRVMIREELESRRSDRADTRNMIKAISSEIWEVGGKYIVAGVVILLLVWIMRATGVNVVDIMGIAGK